MAYRPMSHTEYECLWEVWASATMYAAVNNDHNVDASRNYLRNHLCIHGPHTSFTVDHHPDILDVDKLTHDLTQIGLAVIHFS